MKCVKVVKMQVEEPEPVKQIKKFECGCVAEGYETFTSQVCEENPLSCELQKDNFCSACGRDLYGDFKEDHDPSCLFC